MTSLAALTHSAAPAAPAFNGLFYATAATVIPVLYIALLVQGHAGTGLARAGARILIRSRRATVFAVPAGVILLSVAILIVVLGALAEISAIESLYDGQDTASATGTFVLLTTIFLIAATAAGPVWGLFRGLSQGVREESSTNDAEPPQAPAAQPAVPSAQQQKTMEPTPETEPGKTDPA